MVIRPDGKVSLCVNDDYGRVTLGDAAGQSLTEIWQGEAYRRLRAELTMNGRRILPSAVPVMCTLLTPTS